MAFAGGGQDMAVGPRLAAFLPGSEAEPETRSGSVSTLAPQEPAQVGWWGAVVRFACGELAASVLVCPSPPPVGALVPNASTSGCTTQATRNC